MNDIIPKVSVIFPIYNNERYLEKCIRSVMNQTLKNIELILIDDGSKDNAPMICDRLATEDKRIRVIHKKNEGSAAGRNQGIELARGEYVAFVESDDSVEEEMYEKLYEKAKETKADIVKCGYFCCENGRQIEIKSFYKIAAEDEVFRACDRPNVFMCHASIWAGIYRKDFLNQHNLRCIVTPSATYSDFSWMAMTYAYAERIAIVHRLLYDYTYDNPLSSRVQQNEKCFYKPFHCMQANRILQEAGIFENVKEEIGYHEYRTVLAHARNIRQDLKDTYFYKIRELFLDLTRDGFKFKQFKVWEKLVIKVVLENKKKIFYQIIALETLMMSFMSSNSLTQKILWKIKAVKSEQQLKHTTG